MTIKASFIGRFTLFIDWPKETTFDDTSKSFILSVIGKNPFEKNLEYAYNTRKIKNKPVEIRYIKGLEEINGSHILFISGSEKKLLPEIISHIKNIPILTIGDTRGFAEKGVMLNFYIVDKKIRFEINHLAVKKSSLSMSSLLLEHAKIIKPMKELNAKN